MPPRTIGFFLLLIASPSFAGNLPVGAACQKSNDCKTLRCAVYKCAPTSNYPQDEGSICEVNSQCLSRSCLNRRCGPRVKEQRTTTPKKPATASNTPRNTTRAPVEEVEAPVELAAPPRTSCTDALIGSGAFAAVKNPDSALRYASSLCNTMTPEQLAAATELALAGYGANFTVTAKTVKAATPEQLACAKKEYDTHKGDKRKPQFTVPPVCLESAEVQRCVETLKTFVFKDPRDTDSAKRACTKWSPHTIDAALELFKEGYAVGNFESLCAGVETHSQDEVDCMRREYDLATNNKARDSRFMETALCKKDPAVIECYFEFLDTFYVDEQFTDSRQRSNVESYCSDKNKPDLELLKKVRAAGFTQPVTDWLDATRTLTAPQKACVAKWLEKASAKEKTAAGFHPPDPCAK